uniref:DNA polymerase alpha subunit B n=1 Tax=Evadne anonyx TaxID=141404 RepID=A0A9N6WT06_9CRUS|nr:EOG090X07VJ [Evadne anonyx]
MISKSFFRPRPLPRPLGNCGISMKSESASNLRSLARRGSFVLSLPTLLLSELALLEVPGFPLEKRILRRYNSIKYMKMENQVYKNWIRFFDLLNDFGTFGITINPAVTQKCSELLAKYKITSETLVDSWVAFSTTKYAVPKMMTCYALTERLSKRKGRTLPSSDWSLAVGSIFCIFHKNPTFTKIVVDAVTTPSLNPTPKTDISFSGALNIMVACGPFTLCDDLDFAPMQDLIDRISSGHPHLVILLGPFLDTRNKKIESADLERTYQEEFDLFMDKLQAAILNSVQVVMIPSWRDVHYHTVYPTAPFQSKKAQPNFHFFSDPCILNVSGVFIALTSTDILFHLSKEEIAVTPQGSDRLGRLVTHLFSQQSFYPLHPAAEEMSIDLEHCDKHCKLPFPPHLLIVPSDLRHFIKNVEGCVVVNTERLVKGPSGGTYARLQVTGEESSVQIKGEIVRI